MRERKLVSNPAALQLRHLRLWPLGQRQHLLSEDVPPSEGQRVKADLIQSYLERKPAWLFGKQSSNTDLKPNKVFILWSIN